MIINLKFRETINECIEALEIEINELKTTNRKGNNIYDGFLSAEKGYIFIPIQIR